MPENTLDTSNAITVEPRSSRRRRQIILLVVVLALCVAAVVAFRGVGRWLVREDPLAKADIIVVLSGAMPARAEEAAEIFRMDYARDVWVTRPDSPANELADMGAHYVGEEEYSRQALIHGGVPPEAIRILPDPVIDTEQEIDEVTLRMRLEGERTAIIVTSPQHTRRVKTLWRKLAGEKPVAIVRGAPQDGFDAAHWWRNTRDTFSVVREIMGLLNAWTGLPVRPHSP
ncbi:MAG: YdcF family protein [Candidatus Acidiferrales bacterium]|jgi:uncharacterized SAM-binding protein YcdF (DUF218 family)